MIREFQYLPEPPRRALNERRKILADGADSQLTDCRQSRSADCCVFQDYTRLIQAISDCLPDDLHPRAQAVPERRQCRVSISEAHCTGSLWRNARRPWPVEGLHGQGTGGSSSSPRTANIRGTTYSSRSETFSRISGMSSAAYREAASMLATAANSCLPASIKRASTGLRWRGM